MCSDQFVNVRSLQCNHMLLTFYMRFVFALHELCLQSLRLGIYPFTAIGGSWLTGELGRIIGWGSGQIQLNLKNDLRCSGNVKFCIHFVYYIFKTNKKLKLTNSIYISLWILLSFQWPRYFSTCFGELCYICRGWIPKRTIEETWNSIVRLSFEDGM